jgi:hypothetical protein
MLEKLSRREQTMSNTKNATSYIANYSFLPYFDSQQYSILFDGRHHSILTASDQPSGGSRCIVVSHSPIGEGLHQVY